MISDWHWWKDKWQHWLTLVEGWIDDKIWKNVEWELSYGPHNNLQKCLFKEIVEFHGLNFQPSFSTVFTVMLSSWLWLHRDFFQQKMTHKYFWCSRSCNAKNIYIETATVVANYILKPCFQYSIWIRVG